MKCFFILFTLLFLSFSVALAKAASDLESSPCLPSSIDPNATVYLADPAPSIPDLPPASTPLKLEPVPVSSLNCTSVNSAQIFIINPVLLSTPLPTPASTPTPLATPSPAPSPNIVSPSIYIIIPAASAVTNSPSPVQTSSVSPTSSCASNFIYDAIKNSYACVAASSTTAVNTDMSLTPSSPTPVTSPLSLGSPTPLAALGAPVATPTVGSTITLPRTGPGLFLFIGLGLVSLIGGGSWYFLKMKQELKRTWRKLDIL